MNMNNLMAQAQKMQRDMEKKQKEIYETEFTGKSELVTITMMGNKTVKAVKLNNMSSFDADDIEILEDMIKIACNDAIAQIEKAVESKMGVYAKQLGGLM